jgi:YbbR domain-containing protein
MLRSLWKFLTNNIGLRLTALILALVLWFYVVNELNKGSEEDKQFLNKVLPTDGVVARKLMIKPVFIGSPRAGYALDGKNAIIVPEYCIVVGPKEMLSRIRFAYTMPIDVRGISKPFTKSVPMNPIAPGVYMEETLVQVTVPVERQN